MATLVHTTLSLFFYQTINHSVVTAPFLPLAREDGEDGRIFIGINHFAVRDFADYSRDVSFHYSALLSNFSRG